ncbi:MAG: hypothetical protein ACI4BA_04735 [Prevotella sp.]
MRKMNTKTICLFAAFSCAAIGTVSCTDSDYDLSDVDMTVGIGGGEIRLPISSSDVIPLKEVLKFDDSEVVDTIEGGDYMFTKDGDAVNPAHPKIDKINIIQKTSEGFDFDLGNTLHDAISKPQPNSANGMKRIAVNISESKIVNTFEYEGPQPKEVEELVEAYITAKMKLTIKFSESLKKLVGIMGEMSITLPTYMTFEAEGTSCEQKGTSLIFKNLSTSEDLSLAISINKLTMGTQPDELGKLLIENDNVVMDGNLKLAINVTEVNSNVSDIDYNDCKITSKLEMDEEVTLDKVKGRFDPTIDLSNLGEANITGLPDFLTEENVAIDLDNPQIILTLESDLTVGGKLEGDIRYWRDGQEKSFRLPEPVNLKAAAENSEEKSVNRICICRDKSKVKGDYDQVIETEDIKDLLYPHIIDKIAFGGTATADKDQVYTYELGKTYTVQPAYRIEAPLAFGEDAKIVYTEQFDDWNGDIKDFDVTDGTRVVMEAVVENRIPAYLDVEATPIGIDGNELPSNVIKVDIDADVKASPNGTDVATSDLRIVLTPAKQGLKKLNGVKIKVSGSAKDANGNNTVKGITLNAKKHSLVLKNIRLSLKGKAIADLN